jgi:prepilin-type N-terminal cleavage/methylation domain-containing protein
MNRGFTLVELSIVLVILGLLVGGVLVGQNLIRASELRAVATDFDKYQQAINAFRDKYLAIPGDMTNATQFWGAAPSCPATAGTGTQTCDGNGDRIFNNPPAASQYGEIFTFWQHLGNAGMIEGSYTGMAGSSAPGKHDVGINAPEGRLNNSGWGVTHWNDTTGDASLFDGRYGNNLIVGMVNEAGTARPNAPLLRPHEAWNIDDKIDDGSPARGKMVARSRQGCAEYNDVALTASAADAAQLDANYILDEPDITCAIVMRNLF